MTGGRVAAMEKSTLTLPRMKLECMRCHHTWKQATPLWDRGHLLMKRGDKTVFVMDDVGSESTSRFTPWLRRCSGKSAIQSSVATPALGVVTRRRDSFA